MIFTDLVICSLVEGRRAFCSFLSVYKMRGQLKWSAQSTHEYLLLQFHGISKVDIRRQSDIDLPCRGSTNDRKDMAHVCIPRPCGTAAFSIFLPELATRRPKTVLYDHANTRVWDNGLRGDDRSKVSCAMFCEGDLPTHARSPEEDPESARLCDDHYD